MTADLSEYRRSYRDLFVPQQQAEDEAEASGQELAEPGRAPTNDCCVVR